MAHRDTHTGDNVSALFAAYVANAKLKKEGSHLIKQRHLNQPLTHLRTHTHKHTHKDICIP